MTIDQSNCTNNTAFTTCQHPSTLTDSNTGGNTSNTEDYLVWKSTDRFSRLLFTFHTEIILHAITLYYFVDREPSTANPLLEFLAVSDEFKIEASTPSEDEIINSVTLCERGPYPRNRSFVVDPAETNKLLVNKHGNGYRFGLSEVEFFTDCGTLHILLYAVLTYYTYGSTYSRNGPNVPYMQYKMFTFIKLQ